MTTAHRIAGPGPGAVSPAKPTPPAPPPVAVWPWRGLRMRWYLIALSLAMLVPVLTFAALQTVDAAAARRRSILQRMYAMAMSNTEAIDQGLTNMVATASVLAGSAELRARDLVAFRRAAEQVAQSIGGAVVLRSPTGAQLVATRVPAGAPMPTLPAEDPEARAVLAAGRPFVSDLFSTGMMFPFMVRIAVPAVLGVGPQAERGYAVELAFPPETVRAWMDPVGPNDHSIITVTGRNGLVIARNHELDTYVGRGTGMDVVQAMEGRVGEWHGLQVDGTWLDGAYTRLHSGGWLVAVAAPEAFLSGSLRRSLIWLAATAVLLIGLGLSLSALLARRINRSLDTLVLAAHTLAAGDPVGGTAAALPVREFESVRAALVAAGGEIRTRTAAERDLLAEVRRSRDLLQAVVNGTADPIFARDLHGCFVVMNQAGAAMLGLPPALTEGQTIAALLPPERMGAARAWDWLGVVGLETVTLPAGMLNGDARSERLFQVSKAPWRDAAGSVAGMVCIARDVTERTEAEARLQALQANLARAGRLSAVAAMAAGLAHELNQPLAAATNYIAAADALMELSCAPDCPAKEAIGEASEQVQRAASIVRRLRAFIGQREVETESRPLGPLLVEAAQAAWQHGAPDGASLHFRLEPGVSALVDPVQLQQVVSNLVRNAAEALRAAPGLPRREVWVGLNRTADGTALVSVVDTGPGLEPSRRERLFDVLEGSSKPGGMGVGLAICRTIVAAHGGTLWAEDTSGGGASFLFTLMPSPDLPQLDAVRDHQLA